MKSNIKAYIQIILILSIFTNDVTYTINFEQILGYGRDSGTMVIKCHKGQEECIITSVEGLLLGVGESF
jgi:hypothetical protein